MSRRESAQGAISFFSNTNGPLLDRKDEIITKYAYIYKKYFKKLWWTRNSNFANLCYSLKNELKIPDINFLEFFTYK